MARKIECDRCGTQSTRSEEYGQVDIPTINKSMHEINTDDSFRRDLCFECITKLHEFIQRLPTPAIVRNGSDF